MFTSFSTNTMIEKLCEPEVWFPIVTAIAAYIIQLWVRTVWKRKEESLLAAIYLDEIKKEVHVGVDRLEYLYTHGGQPYKSGAYRPIMPTSNWNGVREIIPDDVFCRILNVAKRNGKKDTFNDFRFHLKNYYTVICKFGNDCILGKATFEQTVAREDLDGSRMVCSLLDEAYRMMVENAARRFWPW